MDLEVAESILPIPMAFNSQQTNSSRYQKRYTSNYLYPTQTTTITDNSSGTSSTSKVQRFLVGSQYFLDCQNSYLSAVVQLSATNFGENTAYLVSNTDCWLQRVTVLLNNGVLIGETRDANILGAMMKRNMEPVYAEGTGRECLAFWDTGYNQLTEQDKQYISMQPMRYNFNLNVASLLGDCFNYLPLRALAGNNSNSIQIEIEWAPFNQMVVAYSNSGGYGSALSGGAVVQYSITGTYYAQSLLEDNTKEQEIQEIIKTTPIILNYRTWRHYQNTLPAGVNGSTTISISEFQEAVEDIMFVFRNQNIINTTGYNPTVFQNPNLITTQLQIGPFYTPSQNQTCGVITANNVYQPLLAENFMEYTKTMQKMRMYNEGFQPNLITDVIYTSVNYALYSKDYNDLIVSFNLRTFPDDSAGDSHYNQFAAGYNTKSSPQALQFIFTVQSNAVNLAGVSGVAPTGVAPSPSVLSTIPFSVDSFVSYRSNIVIQANEVYVIS